MNTTKSVFALAALIGCMVASATEIDCYRAVQEGVYSKVVSACIQLPHNDRMATLEALSTGNYKHYLGTLDDPSPAFSLLHAYADSGDVNAQYMYGLLMSMVHVKSVERWEAEHDGEADLATLKQHNRRVREEAAQWIEKAAERGHTLAMLEAAEDMVRRSYADPSTDLRAALDYAQKAKEKNSRLADHMIERVEKRMKELAN